MEQKGASHNKLGADSCTEMHFPGRESSSSLLGQLPENIEIHHYHSGLPEPLYSALIFTFLYAADWTTVQSCQLK